MAELISKPQKDSTSRTYQCQWELFCRWCRDNAVDPLAPSLNQLCRFFVHLHKTVQLKPATIEVYRAAISSVLKFAPLDFDISASHVLHNLFSRFRHDNPRQRSILPKWDLELVLRSLLKEPFIDSSGSSDLGIPLPWFTRKTVFLIALASGARASEVHALSRKPDLFVMERSRENGVTLRLQPYAGFVPKNCPPSMVPKPWIIPSISHLFPDEKDKLLCPVRAVRYYVSKTGSLAGRRESLFVHPNPKVSRIKVSHISQWIVDVIKNAYDQLDQSNLPAEYAPRAHELRAIAHSWAFFNNVSLEDVLDAARWTSVSTFTGHYLRDVARAVDGLSGFPVVIAQRVYRP